MPRHRRICLLTNAPQSAFAINLGLLYPGRVTTLDFTREPQGREALAKFGAVVTMVTHREALPKLDYEAVRAYADRGGVVVSCLAEYAHSLGLSVTKSLALDGGTLPAVRVRECCEVTRGFALGDELLWFGKVSGATYNDCNPNQYYQRQIMGLEALPGVTILGISNLNGGAVLVEERVGRGRLVAMDLLSLKEPFYDSWGSTNKYLFLANTLTGAVRYGKHYPRKLPYDELLDHMRDLAARHPALTFTEEGPVSDGRPLGSLSVGNPQAPAFLFTNGIHGWEWEAGYGLLHLAELLAGDVLPEGLLRDRFFAKIIPQLNPYGYDHDFRHNANGVDLNRNFDYGWEDYVGGDDVYQPWDFDYKGPQPGSEPESQIVMRLIHELKPVCLLDFHTAHYIFCKPHRGDRRLMNAIHTEAKRRLKDRFLIQRPYSTEYCQVNMDRAVDWLSPTPHLIHWAAEAGVPAPILIEMSGNRNLTQALVMNTDTTIEICLAAMKQCLKRFGS
jgi:hypothetical protein